MAVQYNQKMPPLPLGPSGAGAANLMAAADYVMKYGNDKVQGSVNTGWNQFLFNEGVRSIDPKTHKYKMYNRIQNPNGVIQQIQDSAAQGSAAQGFGMGGRIAQLKSMKPLQQVRTDVLNTQNTKLQQQQDDRWRLAQTYDANNMTAAGYGVDHKMFPVGTVGQAKANKGRYTI